MISNRHETAAPVQRSHRTRARDPRPHWATSSFLILALAALATSPALAQQQQRRIRFENSKVLASDGAADDLFGNAVAVWNNVAIAGAIGDDDLGSFSGSAYVYRFNRQTRLWLEDAKLAPADGARDDRFGQSVAIWNDTALVGAIGDGDNGILSGSAYIFRFDPGLQQWNQETKLLPADGASLDQFGVSVSLHDDIAVVGAFGDDDRGSASGSVYVFRYDPVLRQWPQEAKFVPADLGASDNFGWSTSAWDNVIAGGAPEHDAGEPNAGAVYLFRYDADARKWNREAQLIASDAEIGDRFGESVSLTLDRVAVGALKDDENGRNSGSAYVFEFDNGDSIWNETFKLLAADGAAEDAFGHAIGLSGDLIVVGAAGDDDRGSSSGSVYVFRFNNSNATWLQSTKLLASDGTVQDEFGTAVASSDNFTFIGASRDDDNGPTSGSAYFCQNLTFTLKVEPIPLIAGQKAGFTVANAVPGGQTFLAATLVGFGSTPVPPLNVTLDLANPQQVGSIQRADASGKVVWIVTIPNAGAGRSVAFQVVQFGRKTNAVATIIR